MNTIVCEEERRSNTQRARRRSPSRRRTRPLLKMPCRIPVWIADPGVGAGAGSQRLLCYCAAVFMAFMAVAAINSHTYVPNEFTNSRVYIFEAHSRSKPSF